MDIKELVGIAERERERKRESVDPLYNVQCSYIFKC